MAGSLVANAASEFSTRNEEEITLIADADATPTAAKENVVLTGNLRKTAQLLASTGVVKTNLLATNSPTAATKESTKAAAATIVRVLEEKKKEQR